MTLEEGVPAEPICFGLSVMNFGAFAEARLMADLGRAAEAAGWDGLFVWDHLGFAWGTPSGDAWTLVTAVALATSRIRVGTDVAVIARERPVPFANRVATIDRLSGGRLVLGVGLGGAPDEYRKCGEPVGLRERAELTDEALDLVRRLLGGEAVVHDGPAYVVDEVTLSPLPLQARVPVWIGGASAGAQRRAALWDGWVPGTVDGEGNQNLWPDDLRVALRSIRARRAAAGIGADEAFAVGIHGDTPPDEEGAAIVRTWADAGATWWLEGIHGWRGSTEDLFARVATGPPRG